MASDLRTTHQDATRSLNRSHGSFELAFAPVLLALGGLWLDRTIGTVPVFTIVLAFLGLAGTSVKLYYSYRHTMSELDAGSPWGSAGRSRAGRAGVDRAGADQAEGGA